jgi:hypothetical protein
MRTRIRLWTAVAFCLLVVPSARGDKPNPPPLPPPKGFDPSAYQKVYDAVNEPRVLVICGRDIRAVRGAAGERQLPVASGHVQPDQYAGNNIELFDNTGDAAVLKNEIEDILSHTDTRLVNLSALEEKDRREANLMKQRGMDDVVQLLGTKVNAEVVFTLRMLPGTSPVVPYRVITETVNVTNGHKIGGFSFDWKGGVDAVHIKTYAGAISEKWMRQFADYYTRPKHRAAEYVIRLVGVGEVSQLRKARDVFRKISGMKHVDDPELEKAVNSIATFDVRYEGSPMDLASDLQDAATKELQLTIDAVDTSKGALTLISRPRAAVLPGAALLREDDPNHEQQFSLFFKAYKDHGSPRIGVMVNRELTDSEKSDPRFAQMLKKAEGRGPTTGPAGPLMSGGTMVLINLASGGGVVANGAAEGPGAAVAPDQKNKATPEDLLNTRRVEDYLFQRFVKMRLNVIDLDTQRAELLKKQQKERLVFGEQELVFLLGQQAGVDIVIQGVGRVKTGRSMGYTFRAVQINGGNVLGAEGYDFDTFLGNTGQDLALKQLSDAIAGSLAQQMWQFWIPPTRYNILVHNAKTLKDVSLLANYFRSSVPGVTQVSILEHDAAREGGLATLTVVYNNSFEQFIDGINEMSKKLPYDLDRVTTRPGEVTIKIRDNNTSS